MCITTSGLSWNEQPESSPRKEKEKELNHTTHKGSGVYQIVSRWLAVNTMRRVVFPPLLAPRPPFVSGVYITFPSC